MIAKLKQLLANLNTAAPEEQQYTVELAAASLMIELAKADLVIADSELNGIIANLRKLFKLTEDDVNALLDKANERSDDSTSTFEFTDVITQHFNAEQRVKMIEALWHIAYADGHLDKYEEHFIRKVSDLLYVSHSDYIRAKHHAKASAND